MIDGFALLGDIEILRNEIERYMMQFDITSKKLEDLDRLVSKIHF